jgi:hypothetical protein
MTFELVERTASRKIPVPSILRRVFLKSVSSITTGTAPSGDKVATTKTTRQCHNVSSDHRPQRTKRWWVSWERAPSGSPATIIAVMVRRPGPAPSRRARSERH